MKPTLYHLLTLWLLLWVQVVSNYYCGGPLFSVQWAFLATLYFGLSRGPWVGECMGFTWGLFLDAASLGSLGVNAMLYAVAGYAAGSMRRQLDASKLWTQCIFSLLASVAYYSVYFLVTRFLSSADEPLRWMYLTVPVLNALVAPVLFHALRYWSHAWDMTTLERDF